MYITNDDKSSSIELEEDSAVEESEGRKVEALDSPNEQLSNKSILRLCCGIFCVQQAWAVKVSLTTPLFKSLYGLRTQHVGYIWVAGPVSGLVVQPLLGRLSDVKGGRRKPLLVFGVIGMSVGMICLPLRQMGLVTAIISYWIIDLFQNSVLVAMRAAFADHGGTNMVSQTRVNTAMMVAYGLGSVTGYNLSSGSYRWGFFVVFAISAGLLSVLSVPTVLELGLLEKSLQPSSGSSPRWTPLVEHGNDDESTLYCSGEQQLLQQRPPMKDFWKWWLLPHWFLSLSCLIFFYWAAYYSIATLSTDWVGQFVFGGQPSAAEGTELARRYSEGVRYASFCLSLQGSIIMAMGAGPFEWMVKAIGEVHTLSLGLVVQGGILLLPTFFPNRISAIILLGGTGLPLAILESIPYIIVGRCSIPSRNGEFLGRVNMCIVSGCLLLTLLIDPISSRWDVPGVLRFGGVLSILGLLTIPYLKKSLPVDGSTAIL